MQVNGSQYSTHCQGSIYGPPVPLFQTEILHLFQRSDDSSYELVAVSLTTGEIVYQTSIMAGVNRATSFQTLIYVPPL